MATNEYERPKDASDAPWDEPWPLGMVTLRPFPRDALPPLLKAAVDHLVASRVVHPALPFTAYLGVISGALAEGVSVTVSTTWTMPVNVYALVVALSGDGKSPAFAPAIELTDAIERRRCQLVNAEVVEAKARLIELADEINEAAGKGKGKEPPPRDPARLRRLVAEKDEAETARRRTGRISVQDATPESTADLMARNGGLLIAVDAEGSIIHHAMGLYSTSPNIGLWLAGWSGETYKRDRVREDGAREVIVPSARIGVGAAIQPGVLRSLMNDPRAEDRGFLPRALRDWPPSMTGQRELADLMRHPADNVHLEPLHRRVLQLWENCYGCPCFLALSDEARALFVRWHDERERELPESDEAQRKSVPKVRASVARIAALFHLLTDASSSVIEEPMMRDAISIGDYYLNRQQDSADIAMAGDARVVLNWLTTLDTGMTTVRDVCRGVHWHRYEGGTDRTIAALILLAEHGWVRAKDQRSGFGVLGRRSGRTTPKVILHPDLKTWIVTLVTGGRMRPLEDEIQPKTPTTPRDSRDNPARLDGEVAKRDAIATSARKRIIPRR